MHNSYRIDRCSLIYLDYMKLKRILSKQTIQRRDNSKEVKIPKSENLLYQQSGGLCFDVCPHDSTMYVK